jgi:2-methylisocitrate lyase-like PEP mutase family enzyme
MVSGPNAPPAQSNQLLLSVGLNRRTGIPHASVWQSHGVSTQEERAARFKALHEGEPFVIPNPWDAGSARMLQSLGFQALATTSSGFAFTLGRPDSSVSLDEVAAHVESLVGAVEVPISVDLENGYGPEPRDAVRAVTRVAEAGAVGGSIEDWDPDGHLYEPLHAAERVAEAVDAVSGFGWPFTLTARAENHIRGHPDLDDTIARLQAFEAAGADVLYAPGLASVDEIRQVCEAVSKPVNVLARPGLTLDEIVGAGAQRVSVGGSLTWTAVQALADAAVGIRDHGSFEALGDGSRVRDWLG